MPDLQKPNGKDLGGGMRHREQEAASQVVQIEDGAKILALYEDLGSMDLVVKRLTSAVKSLDPRTPKGQRSLPALCRPLVDLFFKCQAVNMKMAREKQVEQVPMSLLGVPDEDVMAAYHELERRKKEREEALEPKDDE